MESISNYLPKMYHAPGSIEYGSPNRPNACLRTDPVGGWPELISDLIFGLSSWEGDLSVAPASSSNMASKRRLEGAGERTQSVVCGDLDVPTHEIDDK